MASSLGANGGTRLSSACKRHIFRLVNRFHLLIRRMILVIVINDWNGLPYDSVNVHSTNLFKTHLDRFYYDYQYDIV